MDMMEYKKLGKEIIPRLISTIEEMSAKIEKKEKEIQLLFKTIKDEKKLQKEIDEILKKMLVQAAGYREKHGKKRKEVFSNNASETSLISSGITPENTVKMPPQNDHLADVVYSETFPLKFPNIKSQSSTIIVVKTQPITELFISKISKQKLLEKGTDSIKRPTRKVVYPFLTQSQKVFVMDQHPAPKDNEKQKVENTPTEETKSPTKSQQSKEVQETTYKMNSTTSQNQKTTQNIQQISDHSQQSEKQSTILISDSTRTLLGSQTLPEIEITEKDKCEIVKTKVQVGETSNQQNQIIPLEEEVSSSGKAETPEKVSQSVIQFQKNLLVASEKEELVVLKLPDESEYYDEFIPPVAHKSYGINANIQKIEELDAGTEEENGEASETGGWFETAKTNSKTECFSDMAKIFSRKASLSKLYSNCELPTKQKTQSNLQVYNFLPNKSDYVSDDIVNDLELNKSSPGHSLSSGITDLENVEYLDQFDSPDEFDDTMKKQYSDTDEMIDKQVTEIKLNRKVYQYVMEYDSCHDSILSEDRNPIDARDEKPPRTLGPVRVIEKKSESDGKKH